MNKLLMILFSIAILQGNAWSGDCTCKEEIEKLRKEVSQRFLAQQEEKARKDPESVSYTPEDIEKILKLTERVNQLEFEVKNLKLKDDMGEKKQNLLNRP